MKNTIESIYRKFLLDVPYDTISINRHALLWLNQNRLPPLSVVSCWVRQGYGDTCIGQARLLQSILQKAGYTSICIGNIATKEKQHPYHAAVLVQEQNWILDPGLSIPCPLKVPEDYIPEVTQVRLHADRWLTIRLQRINNDLVQMDIVKTVTAIDTRHAFARTFEEIFQKESYLFRLAPLDDQQLIERAKLHFTYETLGIFSLFREQIDGSIERVLFAHDYKSLHDDAAWARFKEIFPDRISAFSGEHPENDGFSIHFMTK